MTGNGVAKPIHQFSYGLVATQLRNLPRAKDLVQEPAGLRASMGAPLACQRGENALAVRAASIQGLWTMFIADRDKGLCRLLFERSAGTSGICLKG